MSTTNDEESNLQEQNLQDKNLQRAIGFISLTIFVILIIAAIALPIEFNVSATLAVTIFSLILSVVGIFFSFLQAFPDVKSHFKTLQFPSGRRWPVLLLVLLILSVTSNAIQFAQRSNIQTPTPTPTTPILSNSGKIATDVSRLIPLNQAPVLDDALSSGGTGYQWDTGKAGGATCSFIQGSYHIQAPAGTGGGCVTEAASTNFTDSVYQIKMTILSGLDKGQGGAGPIFRGSELYGGSFYGISFDANGVWTFGYAEGNSGKTLLGGTSPYFVTGLNQPNFITIRAQGSHIEATVNDHDLFTITDTTLKMGMIGVQMGTGSDGGAEIAFSDAKVWQLP